MKHLMSRFWPIAFPYPHIMCLAPLDVWFRLLFRPRVDVPPRFWPRLAFALLLSLLVTLLTLPERIIMGLWLRWRKPREKVPGPLIVLGYYRSGTTLLQYLLSCDPHLATPDVAQGFLPQGFSVTWFLLRWFVLPFMPRTRPQDNVSFGPLVPIEDDYALNNWALSSTVPGRLVVPQVHSFYDRFHDLKQLTQEERERFARYQLAFIHKLMLLAGGRRILLKTPSHTARIEAFLELFRGKSGVKFVYICRHPHSVLRSNVAMLEQMVDLFGLQPPLPAQELEDYLLREYIATEQEYQRTRSLIPPGDLAEVRLQDLQADPLGTMKRIYQELGLSYTPAFEQGMIAYLNSHRDYKPNSHRSWTAEQKERISIALQPLVEQGRHEGPALPRVPVPAIDPALRLRQVRRGLWFGLIVALLLVVPWFALTSLVGGDSLGVVWPCGVAIGVAVLRGASSQGSSFLGLFSLLLTALVLLAVVRLAQVFAPAMMATSPFYLLLGWFWWALALASAYRIGSQRV